jgi:acetyl-CoA carboxylase carboxyltransferase component
VIRQAGQVWFPDSAFKTAQFIRDINREGLPLLVLANWRGCVRKEAAANAWV